MKLKVIALIIFLFFLLSCKKKNIFSVRLPNNQKDYLTGEKVQYGRAVELRYDENKTLFFASIENMLKFIEKYDWNLLKAGVKKAYIMDFDKSIGRDSEMWLNINVAFLTYIKDKNGKKIIIALSSPNILKKYKTLKPDWKYTKPVNENYFSFIELIRELRAAKKKEGKK